MNESPPIPGMHRIVPALLLACLLLLSYWVLRNFLLTLVWAFILAYVTWPAYQWLRRKLKGRITESAALMTVVISLVIFSTIFWLGRLLQEELIAAYQALAAYFSQSTHPLPDFLLTIPWLGTELQAWIDQLMGDPAGITGQLAGWGRQLAGRLAAFLGNVGHFTMQLGIVLVTLFFCFRDGNKAMAQLRQALSRSLGKDLEIYLQAAGHTTKAVVYGLVLAALAQGFLAGIGYAAAGVEAPALFGAVTAILALVPLGATLVWVPLGGALLLSDAYWEGVGLLAWGFLVVSTVDNIIRPLVISGAGRVPFLVVMFGVLGGLTAFGAVGLFLGPVILAVLLAVWKVWLEQSN